MTDALRIALVDDEPPSRTLLAALIGEHEPSAEIHETDDAARVLDWHAARAFDLIFVDVDLGDASGLVLTEQLLASDPAPLVVLATGSPHHAPRGFELDVLDYLLKPFRGARVAEALRRARLHRSRTSPIAAKAPAVAEVPLGGARPPVTSTADARPRAGRRHDADAGRLWAERADGARVLLDVAAIDWARAESGESRVRTGGEELRVRLTLGALVDVLPPERFLRVHRSWLVNIERVREAVPWDSHSMTLIMGNAEATEIPVGRAYGERLRRIAGW